MPRVQMLADEALSERARQDLRTGSEQQVRVLALTPELYETWAPFAAAAFKHPGRLGLRLKELVRLKSAKINGCRR